MERLLVARKILRLARRLVAFRNIEWQKGYALGEGMAQKVGHGVATVGEIAAHVARNSRVPELARISAALKESGEFGSDFSESDLERFGKELLSKVKRLSPLGIMGAVAGVLEEANVHKQAGLVYDLARKIGPEDDVERFVKLYKSGRYTWVAFFPNRKKPGKRPKYSKNTTLNLSSIGAVVYQVLNIKQTPQALVFTFIGSKGRPDTYVFTHEPYEMVFADKGAQSPKKKVVDIAEEIKQKLKGMGMHSLGTRHAKAGEQFAAEPDSARRIAVGRRDLLLNIFQVGVRKDYELRRPDQRWVLYGDTLLSKVTDQFLEKAVQWAKAGATMIEVRDRAREQYHRSGDGFATG